MMKTIPVWVHKVHDINKVEQCIYDLCFNPDGSQLIIAAGPRVLVHSSRDGTAIQSLTGHKDNVYCVAYCCDGTRFASGGADKVVIIWTAKLEPLLKYPHNEAIQCLAFNPVTNALASCAISDISFWTLEDKSIPKYKSSARINSCSWNPSGEYLALGLSNGNISIRNIIGEEKFFIERDGSPIWALSFSPRQKNNDILPDILCVTDWSPKMIFYSIEDNDVLNFREVNIGFEALTMNYVSTGEYLLVAGCSKQCVLMNKEGVKLGIVGDEQQSWIWSCKQHPSGPFVICGCQDGTVKYFQLSFSTVHAIYREQYAFRENMTNVVIQQLLTNKTVRITGRERVIKIAIYKNRLAVQLPTKIMIYELCSKEEDQIHYQIKGKLNKLFDCNVLVICAEHIVFCHETRLQCYTFQGENVGQWTMEDVIRYIKVIGGYPANEGLIIGLTNGQVLKVFINNPFPILLMKSNSAIICLDLSMSKEKLAIVNEDNQCIVFDIISSKILYQEANAKSVSWNTLNDDMLCYTGTNVLNIKINDCPPNEIQFAGFILGVCGSKAFSLNGSLITVVDIPLSASMFQCMNRQMFNSAYQIACLGVTENDWDALAHAALENLELDVATKAFTRTRDLKYLDLIHEFLESSDQNRESFLGDVFAYEGKYKEASKMYQKAGHSDKALSMYSDMRMFDLAQEFMRFESGSTDKTLLIRKKAEWAKNLNEPKVAAEMYLSAGDTMKAIDIAVENQWTNMLIELSRTLDKIEIDPLRRVAEYLSAQGDLENAVATYNKLGAYENILNIYIDSKSWSPAFALVEKHPQLENTLYLSYARWLVENDQFLDAQEAFHKAGKVEEAIKVLQVLIENSVDEGRLDDAGYYHWLLSRQYLDMAGATENNRAELVEHFSYHNKLADIYYSYHFIQKYVDQPFTSYQPETLFNIARFLLNETKTAPHLPAIAQFYILYSLAKQAKNLGGFKIARQAFEYMQNLRIPAHLQVRQSHDLLEIHQFFIILYEMNNCSKDIVDMHTVAMKAKPYHDSEELLIMCYRCSSNNPIVISTVSKFNNYCVNCKQPFVFSFVAFGKCDIQVTLFFNYVPIYISVYQTVAFLQVEVLPLIEFQLEDGIEDEEALQLLQNSNDLNKERKVSSDTQANFQTLLIEDTANNCTDLFTTTLINFENDAGKFTPIVVDRETLMSMDSSLVLVCQWPKPLRYRYYKNVIPEYHITSCSSCLKIFYSDDYEMEILQRGSCPFCRMAPKTHLSPDHED